MNVCFVSFEFPPKILGGAGTYADLLVKGLSRLGIDVFVLAGGEKDVNEENICRLRVSEKAYLRQFLFMSRVSKTLKSLGKKRRFDVIHYNEPHILRKRPFNLPTLSTFHSSQLNEINTMLKFAGSTLTTTEGLLDLTVRSPVGYIGDVLTGHTSDLIISPSQSLADLLVSQCFIDRRKIRFIPNAVDLERFDRAQTDDTLLERHDLAQEEYILFMGRISAMKGLQYLVEAFRQIKSKRTELTRNLKLVIAGTGSFERSLRRQTSGLEDVVFTGFVDSIEARKSLYSNSLAVVLPSLYEAFPMAILEAMAMSKSVVASCVGDVPIIVENRVNGLIIAPRDVVGLSQSIEILCSDTDLRRQMGFQGRLLVEANYTVEILAEKTFNVYRELIA